MTIRLKRSATAGKVPATTDLVAGELAINTADAKLFLKRDDGIIIDFASISPNFMQAGVGAVSRTLQNKLRDTINVRDFGAVGDGTTDDFQAFQRAVDSLPANGGTVFVPDLTFNLTDIPNWGAKSIRWEIGPGAKFVGAGTVGDGTFPRAATNVSMYPVGTFIQSRSSTVTGVNGDGTGALVVEVITPPNLNGGAVAIYGAAISFNSQPKSNIWASNFLVNSRPGSTGGFWGIEVDVDSGSQDGIHFGIDITGVGSVNPDFALMIQRADTTIWDVGINIRSSSLGINLAGNGLSRGIAINPATVFGNSLISGKSLANGSDAIIIQRNTDTAPTGYFFRGVNTTNTVSLAHIDVLGNASFNKVSLAGNIDAGSVIDVTSSLEVNINHFYYGGASDSLALSRAINAMTNRQGTIRLPGRAGSYLISAQVLTDIGAGTNRIELVGDGWATQLEVATACTNFITLTGGWSGISNLLIYDPNNRCSGAYILAKPASTAISVERNIDRVRVIGPGNASTATFLINDGCSQLRVRNCFVQNIMGAVWNKSGGVDSTMDNVYALGIKYGLRIDSNSTYGHAENLTFSNWTMLCTQANGKGLWITEGLDLRFYNFTSAQLGSGGIGCHFDGGSGPGSVQTTFTSCYFEGSDTGAALLSRGNNSRMHMNGGGFGQGGYSPSLINCIDMDGANGFVFDGVEAFFPNGNCNKVATFANSIGVITEACRNWNQANVSSTEVSCDITWNITLGVPTVRLSTSAYPKASWTAYTPTIAANSGTITTLGAVSGSYRRDGKTVDFRISISITTNGTGSGSILATLPLTAKSSTAYIVAGREVSVTGKMLQGVVFGIGCTIYNYDNSYPGANGVSMVLSGTYEIG